MPDPIKPHDDRHKLSSAIHWLQLGEDSQTRVHLVSIVDKVDAEPLSQLHIRIGVKLRDQSQPTRFQKINTKGNDLDG